MITNKKLELYLEKIKENVTDFDEEINKAFVECNQRWKSDS